MLFNSFQFALFLVVVVALARRAGSYSAAVSVSCRSVILKRPQKRARPNDLTLFPLSSKGA